MVKAIPAGNPEMKHFYNIVEEKLLTHSKKHSHLLAVSKSRQVSNKELSLKHLTQLPQLNSKSKGN